MKSLFLEKYIPTSLAVKLRKEMHSSGETIQEYWERYKVLLASFSHHKIQDGLIIQYFYDELLPAESGMIDTAGGEALMNKTSSATRKFYLSYGYKFPTILE